ncbi:MAG TPA: diacylglycerol kinase family protein [Solirubrobacteraceae bacterium]|nr:diacylglycerol kinase family protein [Solirubrobacteraceae bacterium]
MRLALIANPRSGTAPEPEALEALLSADGAQVSYVPIEQIADEDGGDLQDGALDAVRAAGAPDRIVVAGGDGSVGPAALCAAKLGVPLAVIAVGTANDFARAKDLPLDDLDGACALARDPAAHTAHAELGMAGARPFVNAAAAGLSVAAANAAKPHKSRLGALAYAVGAVKAGVTAKPLRCSVTADGERRYQGGAWQVVVGVTGAFGGGSEIGVVSAHDAMLDVAVVPAGSRAGLVRRAYGMKTGRLTAQSDVAHERGVQIEVEVAGHATFNVDGETCRCEPAHFTLHPGGFDVVTRS